MKIFRYIAILAILISAVSCVQTDVDVPVGATNGKTIQVVAHVASFSDRDVSSRALKVGDESRVKSLCFVVFNTQGVCTRKEYQISTQPITLSTDDLGDGYTLCMFANIENPSLGQGNTMDAFFSQISCPVNSVDIPDFGGEKCFPMYGEKKINGALEAVIQIPLTAMYAKVVVNILSKPDQTVVGNAPANFFLTKFEVHNVAESVDFVGLPEGGKISDKGKNNGYSDDTPVSNVVYTSRNITSDFAQADKEASFYFYLPERFLAAKVAADDYQYPFGKASAGTIRAEDEKYRQGYKPCLVDGKNATFVRFFGEYIDHQGHNYNVWYDIYVGNDNYSNFDIERNVQYNNYVTIKGISKSNDQTQNENSISIDHRVNIERVNPIIVNLRRETLLDSHFEVRPLRIRWNTGALGYDNVDLTGATITVSVEGGDGWVGLERSFGDGVTQTASNSTYLVADDLADGRKNAAGKRKYFTTNLTSETLRDKTITIPLSDIRNATDATRDVIGAVWIYVDECSEAADDVRSATIKITVKQGDESFSTDYIINQRKLFPVTYNGRTYHIEYQEEYLHNFDAEDSYGQTEYEGMPWGLDGVQLSSEHNSFYINEDNSDWNNYVASTPLLKYDFYIGKYDPSDNGGTMHNYAGQEFTDEIFKKSNGAVNILTTADKPSGAVEYCYNRNKRDANGNVVSVDWYLPSADELEDVIVGGYGTFDSFQNKYYWTSQPAYIRNAFYYQYRYGNSRYDGTIEDAYAFIAYEDNKKYARATKVAYRGNDVYDYVQSGLNEVPNDGGHAMDNNCINQGAIVLGYFNVMYGWYRWNGGTEEVVFDTADDHFNIIQNQRGGSRYHVHIGHLYDMTQEGYHERTKYNRVRCLRKNESAGNESVVTVKFNRWEDASNSSITNDNSSVSTNQTIRYYVEVSADSDPTSVTIGGVNATNTTTRATSVWYADLSWSSAGTYGVTVEVTVGGVKHKFSNLRSVSVVDVPAYTISTTAATSFEDGTVYVMQNTNYTSTYLTTSGTNLAATASTSVDEYCFVTIEKSGSSYKIKSVKKAQYFSRNSSNIQFSTTATNLTFSDQGSGQYRISCSSGWSTYYLKQTNDTTVQMTTGNSGNRNWKFYKVTYNN